ncbi:hypothetical protein OPQ81_000569 [Rhizoctonia solani]|nr:hypothetical protein OPQ81_000569 [Rhizoctonia solani]
MQFITNILALISLVSAFAPINEIERNYHKQVPPAFTLSYYRSKANQPPWINGKIIGLGYQETPTSEPVDFIRINYDSTKKFHLTVQALTTDRTRVDYTKARLAAKFPSRAQDPDKYFQSLVDALNRRRANDTNAYEYSPGNIWDRWRTGRRP